ncbi:hypothetical protein Q673_02725 [Marinobacter sp. EN3]|uniref:hypothetical protein n=1 Tax=Marinobacter sp. EN3 TaxID=1397533 RepID=UPI0003B8B337|nr:hypothetical protein [Marinobacter sp. EN3]ERS12545.1 hypothetical protein Q673_02725 [Marinobacter sp. EN3]
MSDTDDPRARLGKMLSAALFISTFGHAALAGIKTRQDLVGDDPDLSDIEINVLAKGLLVDCQVALIEANGINDTRKLLFALAGTPLHSAKEKAERLIGVHTAQLGAVPLPEIERILRDQDNRRREIHARQLRSSENRPQA